MCERRKGEVSGRERLWGGALFDTHLALLIAGDIEKRKKKKPKGGGNSVHAPHGSNSKRASSPV